MLMPNRLSKLLRFEGKTFWVDLLPIKEGSGKGAIEVLDGKTWRSANKEDVEFMELLTFGEVIGDKKAVVV